MDILRQGSRGFGGQQRAQGRKSHVGITQLHEDLLAPGCNHRVHAYGKCSVGTQCGLRPCTELHYLGLEGAERPQYGQVAVSALGSDRACPATAIAFFPRCQYSVLPLSVRRANAHPLTLRPLSTLALRALQGYAYIPVKGHSLPVLLRQLAPFGHMWLGWGGALG